MSDPLSVASAIIGIIGVTGKVCSIIYQFGGDFLSASETANNVVTEAQAISTILSSLGLLLQDERLHNRGEYINIRDFTATFTDCALAFNELQNLLSFVPGDRTMGKRERLQWVKKEGDVKVLLQRLSNHKSSLSCMLAIIQRQAIFVPHTL